MRLRFSGDMNNDVTGEINHVLMQFKPRIFSIICEYLNLRAYSQYR